MDDLHLRLTCIQFAIDSHAENVLATAKNFEQYVRDGQPKPDLLNLAVSTSEGPPGGLTSTIAPQTPSGLTTIAGIGDKKWGA